MSTPNPAATPWVPLWDLTGGVDLAYVGSWQPATTYRDGQVVVYQGVAYLCTRQTTRTPTPWPLTMAGGPTYGTTLPANPVDGQEAVLVDSVTNPAYQWRFRYNAGSSSTYKWEFVGGAPVFVFTATPQLITPGGTWVTSALSFVTPRAGDYTVTGWARFAGTAAGGQEVIIGDDSQGIWARNYTPTNVEASETCTWWRYATPAGTSISARFYVYPSPQSVAQLSLTITPRRVA